MKRNLEWKHDEILDDDYMTLSNVMQSVDSQGNELAVVEELEDSRAFFKVAPWQEANGINTHITNKEVKVTRTPRSRRVNRGNETYFTSDEPHREEISFFEDMILIDEMIISTAVNGEKRRVREIKRHARDLGDGICTILWYGNAADGENEINGIMTRYNSLALDNVWSAKGVNGTNLASLVMIEFDPDFCGLIYPRGHATKGVYEKDLGVNLLQDENNKPLNMYGTQLNINVGLNIAEDCRVQRLANITINDIEDLGTNDLLTAGAMRNIPFMAKALPNRGNGPMTYIFVPREIEAQLEIWASEHTSLCQKKQDLFLKTEVLTLNGISVLADDSLLITEGQVI